MHERINQIRFTLAVIPLFTLGATFNQPEVEGCFNTDTLNNTEFWVTKEQGTPKRIIPHPDSEELGIWIKGTKIILACRRPISFEIDEQKVTTVGYLVRAAEDESDLGWIIPNFDHPGLDPTSAGLPKEPDTVFPEE